MDITLFQFGLIIVGGFLAGVMNTLAGYGSMISLSLLMDVIGLPPNVANGTNRVNVLAQCSASSYSYHKNGKLDLKSSKWVIISMVLGAILGVVTVLHVSNEQFKEIFKYLIIIMYFMIILKPKRWMREVSEESEFPFSVRVLAFFALGFYGGFIQMGMGVFFLVCMVFLERNTLIRANGIKVTIVAIYTVVVLAIFQYQGLVNWKAGLLIAIGQSLGGYLTAKYASQSPNANKWAYYILLVIVIAVITYKIGIEAGITSTIIATSAYYASLQED